MRLSARSRIIVTSALVLALVATAGSRVAHADHVAGGTYTGTSADGSSVSLTVSADGRGIVTFTAQNVRTSACGVISYGVRYEPSPLPISGHAFDDRDPSMLAPRGSFTMGGRASGSFTFADPDRPSCRTNGAVTWQASTTRAPSSQAPPTVVPPASGIGDHQFSGDLTVDGAPGVRGFTVIARIGNQECGRSRTSVEGRYSITVAAGTQLRGCGVAGSQVQFAIAPPSGDAWRFERTYAFQPGSSTRVDLRADLTRLDADPSNVPLHNQFWRDPGAILIAPCGDISDATLQAAAAAVAMWQDAARRRGLAVSLDAHPDACRDDVASIVISEVNWPDRPRVIGAQVGIGWDGVPCARTPEDRCDVYTSFVTLNRAARTLSATERANALAHEIGHALGLEHAGRCSGGTIMFEDTSCLYPLRLVGVDDIAALNSRYAPVSIAAFRMPDITVEESAIKGQRGLQESIDTTGRHLDDRKSATERAWSLRSVAPGKPSLLESLLIDPSVVIFE